MRVQIYWTVANDIDVADGQIYWAYMDKATGTAHTLASTIGQHNVIDPTGIAIHYQETRIYWLDKGLNHDDGTVFTRLLKCNRDGTGFTVVYNYTLEIGNFTPSGNSSELFLDHRHNNTAFFMDLVSEHRPVMH
jgi:hypothetical protein